ncbi:hypothetical protein [Halobellus marinus]|uniref:hypothetical protein n=1 Tax=Halobellus TaxID=1073986 RepID=UPI0028A85149|nr:hypothetical protein [Halobellus sp. DFY28]
MNGDEPGVSDQDSNADQVIFEVETLTHGSFRVGYSPESAKELAQKLDRATTFVACPDGHDIITISGGIPNVMPQCDRCGREAVGVVKIEVVAVPDGDDGESIA